MPRNHCQKDCCRGGRDPNTIPLSIRLTNNTLVGLTGPARYELHRVVKRGLPGTNLDRKDVYQPISFAAKREWVNEEDGWQTVHHTKRRVKAKSKSKAKAQAPSPVYDDWSEQNDDEY